MTSDKEAKAKKRAKRIFSVNDTDQMDQHIQKEI